jgi:LacI family transcriptional regulator
MVKRVSVKDIAREAGVSIATVSYVINKRTDQVIAPQTVKRVEEAVARLGYVPNLGARALASRKTKLIGLMIPQTEKEQRLMFSNSFYGEFLSGLEYEASKKDYSILISGSRGQQSYSKVAKTRSLDGIVVVGVDSPGDVEDLKKADIPVVLVDYWGPETGVNKVNIEDKRGGYLAARHFLDMGHRKIALATGYLKAQGVNAQRHDGYRQALQEAGIEDDPGMIFSGTVSYEYGLELGGIIDSMEDRPTAVFCTADILALGLIKGLAKASLRVPEDVSVIGFDDGFLALAASPELTSIRQDVAKKAEVSAQLLIDALDDKGIAQRSVVLQVSLVERGTVKRI